MAEIRKLYNDDIIGAPKSDILKSNAVKGVICHVEQIVDGEMEQLLYQERTHDNYTLQKNITFSEEIVQLSPQLFRVVSDTDYWHVFNNIDFTFSKTVTNAIRTWGAQVSLVYDRYTSGSVTNMNALNLLRSFTSSNRGSSSQNVPVPFFMPYTTPPFDVTQYSIVERLKITTPLISITKTPYTYTFRTKFDTQLNSRLNLLYVYNQTEQRLESSSTSFILYQPLFVEIVVNGEKLETIPLVINIGEQTNALEMPSNPLVTTTSTYTDEDGNVIPLYQYLANKRINEWHDGKQTVELTKIIDSDSDIVSVDETVMVINARKNTVVDENAQSYFKNRNGIAKIFIVTEAEFIYDGSYKQILKLQEK